MRTVCRLAMMALMLAVVCPIGALAEDEGLKLFENWQANVTANVNLRRTPSLGSDVVVRLNTNDRVLIRGIKGDWFQVIAETGNNAHKGWVHGHYVRKAAPAAQEAGVETPAPVTPPPTAPAVQPPPAPTPAPAVVAPAPAPAAMPVPATVEPAPTPATAVAAAPAPASVAPAKPAAPAAATQSAPAKPVAAAPAVPAVEAVEPPRTAAPAKPAAQDPATAPGTSEQEKSFEFAKDVSAEEPIAEQAGVWDFARLSLRFAALMLAATAFVLSRRQSGPLVTARC